MALIVGLLEGLVVLLLELSPSMYPTETIDKETINLDLLKQLRHIQKLNRDGKAHKQYTKNDNENNVNFQSIIKYFY